MFLLFIPSMQRRRCLFCVKTCISAQARIKRKRRRVRSESKLGIATLRGIMNIPCLEMPLRMDFRKAFYFIRKHGLMPSKFELNLSEGTFRWTRSDDRKKRASWKLWIYFSFSCSRFLSSEQENFNLRALWSHWAFQETNYQHRCISQCV